MAPGRTAWRHHRYAGNSVWGRWRRRRVVAQPLAGFLLRKGLHQALDLVGRVGPASPGALGIDGRAEITEHGVSAPLGLGLVKLGLALLGRFLGNLRGPLGDHSSLLPKPVHESHRDSPFSPSYLPQQHHSPIALPRPARHPRPPSATAQSRNLFCCGGLATHCDPGEPTVAATYLHDHIEAGSGRPATTGRSARIITFALVEAPVTLSGTRHECQRRGAEPAGGRGGCTVTRPVGVPRLVPLVCRRHVDLLRVSSAMCRFCR